MLEVVLPGLAGGAA